MTAKADAFQKIRELVQKFLHNRERYEAPDFNEASTRQEFINPLFEALGWDIGNKKGHSPNYQEVVLEANVKTAEGKKRSDYIFRIGEKPVFIVEGKKLSVSLGKGHEAGKVSYQIRNYAWNASLAVSLVTNFKEIVVYDCRNKPKENDKNTAIQHIKIENFFQEQGLRGDEFPVDFDFLWETFGRDNVWKGNLEKYIQNDTGKFGILSVDDDFLNMLETWRRKLAADIFRNNKNMTEQELNVSVQQIIDRIVFLRLAEDRNIEHGRSLAEAAATYEKFACCRNLFDRFSQADEKYNSGLFRSGNGTVSHNLLIGNHVLKEIIQNLYHYYDFSLIPIEILGSAYERFLGSEIKIVSGTVRTELKPEVRKQGGVFYTPQYIVDYIVKNTVGKLLEGKNAKEAAKITVLDPACGSGSFLVGAYSFLLRWYQNYYLAAKVSRGRKNDPLTPDGLLTIEERKRILLNNIYGVDIDANAVEITKLSLLLKCMEGLTAGTAERLRGTHEPILPDIDANIVCGNSLIDTDFYDRYPNCREEGRIKPMNLRQTFSAAFKQGGFDAVISNPPWEVTLGKDDKKKEHPMLEIINVYCKAKYQFIQGEINLYKIFTERNIDIIKEGGYVGMIMPTSLLNDFSNKKLRELFISRFSSIEVNQFPEKARVFKHVTQDVCIYLLTNHSVRRKILLRTNILKPADLEKKCAILPANLLTEMGKIPLIKHAEEIRILKKLNSFSTFQDTGFIEFMEGEIHLTKFRETICAKEKAGTRRLIRGDAVQRYFLGHSAKDSFIHEKNICSLSHSPKFQHAGQYRLVYQQVVNMQKKSRLNFQLLTEKFYVANTCGYVLNKSADYHIKFLLGLLNSALLNWRYKLTSSNNHVLTNELYSLPFPPLDFSRKQDKQIHDAVVLCVEQLLKLYEERAGIVLPGRLRQMEDKIAHFEKRLNEHVYHLYGLTDKEIAVIEGECEERRSGETGRPRRRVRKNP